jgi:hypothetical protein
MHFDICLDHFGRANGLNGNSDVYSLMHICNHILVTSLTFAGLKSHHSNKLCFLGGRFVHFHRPEVAYSVFKISRKTDRVHETPK